MAWVERNKQNERDEAEMIETIISWRWKEGVRLFEKKETNCFLATIMSSIGTGCRANRMTSIESFTKSDVLLETIYTSYYILLNIDRVRE